MHSVSGVKRKADGPNLIRLTDENSDLPLHERVYRRVRSLIQSGALPHGSRLASSRVLATSFGISRNSVLTALDRLVAEGWLEAHKTAGTFVLYDGRHAPLTTPGPSGELCLQAPFSLGMAALDLFPSDLWNRLQSRCWKRIPSAALQEGEAMGWPALRQAIAAHVAVARGFECSPEQVMVSTSVSAAMDLAIRALDLAGSEMWIEDPAYIGFHRMFQNSGVRAAPVRVDHRGIDVEYGKTIAPHARAVVVNPACHFPTNVTMAPERRAALVQWTSAQNAWIFEDDHDWHSIARRDVPRPLASVESARTIYFDSFNLKLFPGLRIAYLICPPGLVDSFIEVRKGLDGHSNVPNQVVLADFINGGHLDVHLKRLRAAYQERRHVLIHSLKNMLEDRLTAQECDAGTQVVALLRNGDESEFVSWGASAGISLRGMNRFRLVPSARQEVLFGFAAFNGASVSAAVKTLRHSLDSRLYAANPTSDVMPAAAQ